ncbi:ATP-binding protein [Rugosimonospora acidiphila]|uniref:anti-sigma regulatory factor n=1 Tax=Rugosimonospora acidiphila TaxID=556531 RepID=UPI0031EC8BB3
MTQLAPRDPAATSKDDVVVLVVPADGSYLAVLRTATAGLAARLQFTLDEIEDLRIAVDEACAMLLAVAPTGAELTCEFEVTAEALAINVTAPVKGSAALPGGQSFAWQVLTALAGKVSADTTDERATIRLTKHRSSRG